MPEIDEEFKAHAAAFVGLDKRQTDLAMAMSLDRQRLDYSVTSLKIVDDYLGTIHSADERQFSDDEYGNAILWAAAYVGEVVRRSARTEYSWSSLDDFARRFPEIASRVPRQETTQWVLSEPGGSLLTPIERVMRRGDYWGQ
jgi:hypothetical protein